MAAADLTSAGLRSMLEPHRDRVLVRKPGAVGRAHVEIIDVGHGTSTPPARLDCPRIALTWDDTPRSTHRAQELGASRLLPMSVAAGDLVEAIEELHFGTPHRRGDRTLTNPLAPPGPALLSPRESDIMVRICRGLSNDEIARELFLSLNTVKTYIRSAYHKMQVSSRSQAVLWGLDHGY